MGKTPLRKVSEKQAQKLRLWNKITIERIRHLIEKYGVPICEYCGKSFYAHIIKRADGHHIDGNRNNNTPENCYIAIGECHSFITDHNAEVSQEDFQGCKQANLHLQKSDGKMSV